MQTKLRWKSGMEFDAELRQHHIIMDSKTPIGKDQGATPKELVVAGLAGCTAMDVIALLKKFKQSVASFSVITDVTISEAGKYPVVFTGAKITFSVDGDVDSEKLIESVVLSQTKYCGVSAMFAELFPIEWNIILNGAKIKSGLANFKS
jgi:putative redox protein